MQRSLSTALRPEPHSATCWGRLKKGAVVINVCVCVVGEWHANEPALSAPLLSPEEARQIEG